ncbi:uncharacterized protein LOC144865554 [Branchiostoma floridae x Branchiostoma japonicum]
MFIDEEQNHIHELKAGDFVKVAVSAKRFNVNQIGHGGPVDNVRQVMEKAGIVQYVDRDGDALVIFQDGIRNHINPESLEKVNPEDYNDKDSCDGLKEGACVIVDADRARFKQVQTETIPWDDGFYAAAGKVGWVQKIHPSGKIASVNIDYGSFPLNSALVKRASLVDMQKHLIPSNSPDFARGDLVKVNVSAEELKVQQVGHGGYIASTKNISGCICQYMQVLVTMEAGSVCFIDCEGDVYVRFNSERMCLNPTVLTKVTAKSHEDMLHVGDLVSIESDLEKFKSLQTPYEHGGYQEDMAQVCGKTARVMSIFNDKRILVKVLGRPLNLNPALLRRLGEPGTDTACWKSATICAPGKHDWSTGRSLLCVVCGECTQHGKMCPAPRRPDRTPGSVTGCGNGHAGCDDCGACRACAEDAVTKEEVEALANETIEKIMRHEGCMQLQMTPRQLL